tara:strand:- start:2957 stop:4105 length:1149 start_codon:yes stop_codon:yes gene_type:complete
MSQEQSSQDLSSQDLSTLSQSVLQSLSSQGREPPPPGPPHRQLPGTGQAQQPISPAINLSDEHLSQQTSNRLPQPPSYRQPQHSSYRQPQPPSNSRPNEKQYNNDTEDTFKMPSFSDLISTHSSMGKTVVLLLLLLLFAILFRMGTKMLIHHFGINTEPFIIDGMVAANNSTVVSTNPNIKDSVPILRSINEDKGVEFTWSCWFNIIDPYVSSETNYKKIFSKGLYYDRDMDDEKKLYNNSPGLYLNTTDDKNVITVVFTTFSKDRENIIEQFDIDNIPIKKWVSCVITVENKLVNIYINGLIKLRKQLSNLPVQNYYDTYVGDKNGFKGYISDLKYLNYSANYAEVQRIFTKGPNTKNREDDVLFDKSPYLSLDWYKRNLI